MGYFILTDSGSIRLVNLTGARLVGIERGRLVGQGFRPLVAEASRSTFRDFLARVFANETKQNCNLTLSPVAGSSLIVQLGATLSPDRTGCRAVMLDSTERKRAEEQLKTSLAQLGELKQALDGHAIVASTDPRGKIAFVNDKFCAISKYSCAELPGQDHCHINSGQHSKEFMRDLWTTTGWGQVWQGEVKNRAKDGSFYWVAATIVPSAMSAANPAITWPSARTSPPASRAKVVFAAERTAVRSPTRKTTSRGPAASRTTTTAVWARRQWMACR